jgi:biopolymer transport protein ExbB
MKNLKTLALLLLLSPALAHAWWDKDWKERTQIVLNTSPAGVETKEAVSSFTLPVRLHSGNFDFLSAKSDGSDLRVVAADDKTPLPFWIERFDSVNELAVVWVQVPNVLPGTDKNIVYVYAGNAKAPPAEDAHATVFDSVTLAAFHFAEKDGVPADHTGTVKADGAVTIEPNGLIGPSAKLIGAPIAWPGSDKLRFSSGGPMTVSLWIRSETGRGVLYSQGPLQISLQEGKPTVSLDKVTVGGGNIPVSTWAHLALTVGNGKLTLYVDGAQAGQTDLPPGVAPVQGDIKVGDGYQGLIEELQLASTLRSGDWITLSHAAQAADAKLIATKSQTPDSVEESEQGSQSYFGILFKNLTADGWAVIGLLAVMFAIAVWVMVDKTLFISRTDKANRRFLARYRNLQDVLAFESVAAAAPEPVRVDVVKADDDEDDEDDDEEESAKRKKKAKKKVTKPKGSASTSRDPFRGSSLHRLYRAGVTELAKRNVGRNGQTVSGATLDAVKASIDADMVRETNRLNARMVLLTIAIAGGPFLGLLGTVVGVMITFAAIAAAGDVNVNAIAPGIAAALLATVAGLGVAIPSLFGYNYLASRIKVISSDMQIFVDEFVTRVAEIYGAP